LDQAGDYQALLVIFLTHKQMIWLYQAQKPAHYLTNTLEVAWTESALKDGIQPAEIIGLQTGFPIRINLSNRWKKQYIGAGTFQHFNIFFQTDGVFFIIPWVIELSRIYKNAANTEIGYGPGGCYQVHMSFMQCPHGWNKADYFPNGFLGLQPVPEVR
jgi:hypothetical protein